MPGAYHSSMNKDKGKQVCGCTILPLRTQHKGPAGSTSKEDILDEVLQYFKANIFFRNFEIKGGADRVLVYMTLYISYCIEKTARVNNKTDGEKKLFEIALEQFAMPGDGRFPLGGLFPSPKDRKESDEFKSYFTQLRKECSTRLGDLLFNKDGSKNKWWYCFARRKFLNKHL
eukprot:TRINITY_DN9397_c0_g1_i2.p1 TRINITY_DN9397_c0_g1~~TRINITY_DN9397_c0_g1_i2.p1  ORF type:complete len:173 (+),score=34.70 TRINITY_DN9397_c0_g1_i2:2-520(+)